MLAFVINWTFFLIIQFSRRTQYSELLSLLFILAFTIDSSNLPHSSDKLFVSEKEYPFNGCSCAKQAENEPYTLHL